jgi:ubiquinone/menaquinone biosynthesis C-methylase UbiE
VANQLDFVRRRYKRLAPIYPLFNFVFALPSRLRAQAVGRLNLEIGATALEVGCGTGSNFLFLETAVGEGGAIFGVDASDAMLVRAAARCHNHNWKNVTLLAEDAAEMVLPAPVDGVLFSVSYSVMPDPRRVLARAWSYLRKGGSIVILDGTLANNTLKKLVRPFAQILSRATVLGNLDRRPWNDFRDFTSQIEVEELRFGYYLCRGVKV